MAGEHNPLLWENNTFTIRTPANPHVPYSQGLYIVVAAKQNLPHAWQNPELAGKAFELSAKICQIMETIHMAPWFNIQSNGNWGLLEGATPFFHIHVYGRNRTSRWGKPIILPDAPKTYNNDPMPQEDIEKLRTAFKDMS